MKRRTISRDELAHVSAVAAKRRTAIGLDPVPAENIEYEARRAELRAKLAESRGKGRATLTHTPAPPREDAEPLCSELNERHDLGDVRVDARVYWTAIPGRMESEAWVWELFLSRQGRDGGHFVTECEFGSEPTSDWALLKVVEAALRMALKFPELG